MERPRRLGRSRHGTHEGRCFGAKQSTAALSAGPASRSTLVSLRRPAHRGPVASAVHKSYTARSRPAPPPHRDAFEGKRPQRRPQERLDGRFEEVAKAVRGGYCRSQMPLKLALGVRGTVAEQRLGALEGGRGTPPSNASLPSPPPLWSGSMNTTGS